MRFLLDTHVALACVESRKHELKSEFLEAIENPENTIWVSVLSLWEIAIKSRLGKLPLTTALPHWPAVMLEMGFKILPINFEHVVAEVIPVPVHRDPFDRLLLGICSVENMRLMTIDRMLVDHPLAWRAP